MSATAVRAGAYLHHLALESAQPERLAQFYTEAMDMTSRALGKERWHCIGPGRNILLMRGRPKALAFAGFACRDREGLDELRARAEREGIACEISPSPLFGEEAFTVRDPDGNTIVFGLARADAADKGLHAPLQHLTLGTSDVKAVEAFYAGKLGFLVSDRVVDDKGAVRTCFMRSNHEHHTLGCFQSARVGVDHHSYEAGEWIGIRDWADRFADRHIRLMWGPGRHGPGNNLFIFIEDPDGNWIEISAELEVIADRLPRNWPHEERSLNLWGSAIMRS